MSDNIVILPILFILKLVLQVLRVKASIRIFLLYDVFPLYISAQLKTFYHIFTTMILTCPTVQPCKGLLWELGTPLVLEQDCLVCYRIRGVTNSIVTPTVTSFREILRIRFWLYFEQFKVIECQKLRILCYGQYVSVRLAYKEGFHILNRTIY